MNKEEKIEEIISRHLFSYGYEREAIIKAMKEYAIAMCDYQKKECAEKLDIAGAHFTNDDGYEWLASNIVSETKNVAE